MVTFIVRCRRCKLVRRFEAAEVDRQARMVGRTFQRVTYDVVYDVSRALPFVSRGRAVAPHDRPDQLSLVCPAGHYVVAERIRGRKTDKKCDARCLAATGSSCECACGGKNHGASHDAIAG